MKHESDPARIRKVLASRSKKATTVTPAMCAEWRARYPDEELKELAAEAGVVPSTVGYHVREQCECQ